MQHHIVLTTPEKFVPTGHLREILILGGFVKGVYYPHGPERTIRLPHKPYEELTELCTAFQDVDLHAYPEKFHQKMAEEITDIFTSIAFVYRSLPGFVRSNRALRPANARGAWQQLLNLNAKELSPLIEAHIQELATATIQGLHDFRDRPDIRVTQDEINDLMKKKEKRSGKLEGWTVTHVALPTTCPLLEKFTPEHGWTIDTSGLFTIEHSLTLDTINAVTPQG